MCYNANKECMIMVAQTQTPVLESIRKQAAQLSQQELLQLIAYLAEQVSEATPQAQQPVYKWSDIAGIAPNLLEGRDAQEWVNEIRAQEWERDIPR